MSEEVIAEETQRRIQAAHPSIVAITAYWREKAGQRSMPSRADIDPVDLKSHLPGISLVDVVPDARRFVYRLVGTYQVAQRGADPTGRSVLEAYYAADREETVGIYEYVVRTKRPFCYSGPYNAPDGLIEDEDIVFLPLSDNGRDVNMVLVYAHSRIFNPRDEASFILRRGQES
ncbi:PAS domain-containing protein [Dongia soli]|uniref:PAS domain-containing protein n=1 Tax=Dongia soli TaxID=600628 RepID=A0ABU5EGC7_9PROT|nr:PAS domain-containing protein [Dongia soli]MDY0884947.1 PAS domain-containing protein [Dongia soli]